jgi:hypothetical protein
VSERVESREERGERREEREERREERGERREERGERREERGEKREYNIFTKREGERGGIKEGKEEGVSKRETSTNHFFG